MTLFEAVVRSKREYSYLHLISGVDLPLKTQDYIHDFCERLPQGTNLLGIANDKSNLDMLAERTERYYMYTNQFHQPNVVMRWLFSKIRSVSLRIQRFVGYKRDWKGLTLAKGSNWCSITIDFAAYLVANKNYILKKFRGVPCADECYKQTMALSSDFRNTLTTNEREANGRKIDWTRGNPYVWQECDYDELMSSSALFARKFSSRISKGLITKIYNTIKNLDEKNHDS